MVEIIAEIGVNWMGNFQYAIWMIEQVKKCGGKIAKFQIYDVDKVFPDKQIMAQGRNWYEEVKKTQLTKEQTFWLADYCQKQGLEFFASAFDLERLGWLEEIGVKRLKIASRSIKDKELIEAMCKTGKDLIVSLGCWQPAIVKSRLGLPILNTKGKLDFLYALVEYPAPLGHFHLNEVDFNLYSGISDHSIGLTVPRIALSRGAHIVEKHFCLSRLMEGPDIACSITPKELSSLVRFAK